MSNKDSEEWAKIRNHRDLISADNLASWSAIGIVIPIIGILVAISAKQKLNYVEETKENWEQIQRVKYKANSWIIFLLLWAVFSSYLAWIITEQGVVL